MSSLATITTATDDTFGLSENYYADVSRWYQAGYSLGLIGALAVLLTGVMFWNDMVKSKIYMKLLMAVSLCDALASAPGIFGFGEIPNALCATQGAMWYFFNRASWMFTVCITVTLFTQVTYDRIFVQFNMLALIVLVLSVVLIILPLVATSNMEYGDGDNCDYNIGLLRNKHEGTILTHDDSALFNAWYVYMFVIPFSLTAGLTVALVLYMHVKIYHRTLDSGDVLAKHILQSIHSVLYYPLLMLIFWLPNFIVSIWKGNLADQPPSKQTEIMRWLLGTYVWSSIYPVGIAVYYFYKSEEARMRWRDKLGFTAHATVADMPIDQDRLSVVVQENSTFNPANRSVRRPPEFDVL